MEHFKGTILPFHPPVHVSYIESWLRARDMNTGVAAELPEIGVVAVTGTVPVAAGFLRRVEGGFALLDSLITDPFAPPGVRNEAVNAVVSSLIEIAKLLDISRILANSIDRNTLLRSEGFGFVKLPHTLIALNLEVPPCHS